MKRLVAFFNSMAGRIFLVLVLGMAISGSVALGLADIKRRSDLDRLHLERAADRTEDFVSLLNNASGPLRDKLASQGAPGVDIAPAGAKPSGPAPNFNTLLKSRMASAKPFAQRAGYEVCRPPRPGARPRNPNRQRLKPDAGEFVPPECWLISITLKDGAAVNLAVDAPPRLVGERRVLDPVYLAIMAIGAAILAFIIAGMAAAPLNRLGKAARDLGRNLDREPLEERGPPEVRDAARAFNAMQGRLQKTLSERTQMLAAITHDLQTPLTRLRLRLEKVGDETLREKLLGDLGAMQSLIREGLDLARSTDTAEAFARLDLDSLLTSLVEDAADAGQNAELVALARADVLARPQALRRCIANLIDNALKYGEVALVSSRLDKGKVIVTVRDRGPGVPDEQLETVFDPFVRLETSRSRETGGAGLGLTIARALAEKNNGGLTLRNAEGGGLEAILTLSAV